MTEENRLKLKDQLPLNFKIDGAMDYPNDLIPHATVLGMIGKYGIRIEWNYISDPEDIYFCAVAVNNVIEKVVPILQLKENLLKLI